MSDSESMHDPSSWLISKKKSKWRSAFFTVYCSRAFLSLLKPSLLKITETKSLSGSLSPVNTTADSDPNLDDFGVDQTALTQLVKNKNLYQLQELGGVEGVISHLKSDAVSGIPSVDAEDILKRIKAFGSNVYQKAPTRRFFHFVWEAFKDLTILILLGCAALSLDFGIKEHGFREGWIDGGSILLAVILAISVSAIGPYLQSKHSVHKNIQIEAVRGGKKQKISLSEAVVGDVIILNCGDQVPADGLLVEGYSLQVDQSSMSGQSDDIVEISHDQNPFLFSGTKITHGYARMIVISVGMNTKRGEMTSQISQDTSEKTLLQARLEKLTSLIGKVGLVVAFAVIVVLLVRYFTGHTEDENGDKEFNSSIEVDDMISAVTGIIMAAVSIVVVAIPEGLPLALTLTVAYSMKKMMADKATVLRLSAAENMAFTTTICTDKTGTLTMNQMKVTKFWIGENSLEQEAYSSKISHSVLNLIQEGVALNTSGSVYKRSLDSEIEISGSPTEKAILWWAVYGSQMDAEKVTKSCSVLQFEAFNSQNKRSGVLIKRKKDSTIHVHWKGAAEIILGMCSSYYEPSGVVKHMDDNEKGKFQQIIQGMAASRLRCIAFAHKEIPADQYRLDLKQKIMLQDGFTLLGLIGLKDPCRPGVWKAVKDCQNAGVNIKMITGDNVFTAQAIATECGILKPGQDIFSGAVIEGAVFQSYSDEDKLLNVDNICVMARSSALDKLTMVQCLKKKRHVVAVTGDGASDAPALKEADIGLSLGIKGTQVAKESSDIIIIDDNFASVVNVLACGRCVYHNTQKLIQFQLTANFTGLVINFAAAASSRAVPFTVVRSIWLNLIMDTLLALALSKDKPTKELMEKPPVGRTNPLITNIMWRNLSGHALYQTIVLLVLQFKGKAILGVDDKVLGTLVFNTYLLCQVFNEFNARKLEKKDIFRGLHTDKLFMGVITVAIVLQVVTLELLSKYLDTGRLNCGQWGLCLGVAAMSWPIGWVVKCIPVPQKPILRYLLELKLESKQE